MIGIIAIGMTFTHHHRRHRPVGRLAARGRRHHVGPVRPAGSDGDQRLPRLRRADRRSASLGGALNGAIIAGAGVNPLIVTLGTLTAFRGFVVWYRVNPIYDLQPYYRVDRPGNAPRHPGAGDRSSRIVAIVASVVLTYTRFGRYVYAVGGNREAARAAGINVGLITFAVYVISGLCVGIAALIFTSRLMAAQAISGQGFELQAIAAAVVGGASLFGGRGKISNTIVGALIMGVLFNGFVMLDVPQPIQQMAVGVIIIVAVWLDGVLRNRRRAGRVPGR